jgi:hypothetical protein
MHPLLTISLLGESLRSPCVSHFNPKVSIFKVVERPSLMLGALYNKSRRVWVVEFILAVLTCLIVLIMRMNRPKQQIFAFND